MSEEQPGAVPKSWTHVVRCKEDGISKIGTRQQAPATISIRGTDRIGFHALIKGDSGGCAKCIVL